MARKKTPKSRLNIKAFISNRLKEVRQELFGEHGGPELARRLNLPARTWYNYETGVTVPAEVLLSFIEQTSANPMWLLSGDGPKYRRGLEDQVLGILSPEDLIRRGLEKLERRASEVLPTPGSPADAGEGELVSLPLVDLNALADPGEPVAQQGEQVLVYRNWLARREDTVAVRLPDDAMNPILPEGSIVAVDRAQRDVDGLHGRIVAAMVEGRAVVRWLEISGRHLILRPNHPGPTHSTVALERSTTVSSPVLGQVVWSWSRFVKP